MPKLHTIEVQVHMKLETGFRIKISLLDLGCYINGARVFPPKDEHDWKLYPPQKKVGSKYIDVVEFDHNTSLWQEMYEASIEAVKQYIAESKDVVILDIPDHPISLDDIPDFK